MDAWSVFLSRELEDSRDRSIQRRIFSHIASTVGSIEKYTLVDPWRNLDDWEKPANHENNTFQNMYISVENIAKSQEFECALLRGTTIEVVDQVEDLSQDFIYVDGDHSLRGILIVLMCWFPKVKYGGVLAGDDAALNIYQHSPKYGPTLVWPAVIYFAEAVGAELYFYPVSNS